MVNQSGVNQAMNGPQQAGFPAAQPHAGGYASNGGGIGASHSGGHGPGGESAVERTLGSLRSLNPIDPAALPAPAEPQSLTIDDLYRSHRMGMVRLAILLVDDIASAEDVVQEAFAGLYKQWGSLRDTAAAIGYLRTAVVNGSRSMLRRRRTARAYTPPDPGTARSAESLAIMSAEHRAVVEAMGELAPRQREVLVLRYYGGLSESEIAEATGLSKGTVKSTASRAVAKLGDIMKQSLS